MRAAITLNSVASIRNWFRITRRGAPSALRMPISRVRSVTVTSMMLVMPMPPTSRLIAATAPSRVVKVSAVCVWVASSCDAFWIRYGVWLVLAAVAADTLIRWLRMVATSLWTASTLLGSAASTRIELSAPYPVSTCRTAVTGPRIENSFVLTYRFWESMPSSG